jgi:transposase
MYPIDRRYIACNIYSMIKSLRKTATLVNVSHTTVARWIKDPTPKGSKELIFLTMSCVKT